MASFTSSMCDDSRSGGMTRGRSASLSQVVPPPVRARRITVEAHRQRRHQLFMPTPIMATLGTSMKVSSWFLAHFNCLLIILLVFMSGINLPLIIAAASASSGSYSASNSNSDSSSSGTSSLKPHVLLISLPWRGHVFPLRHLGSRLVERGFHVSFAVASEESKDWLAGSGMEVITGGNFKACARIKRQRERQPTFAQMSTSFAINQTYQAQIHPGATLVDLFNAPNFEFQASDGSNSTSPNSPPNGIALLMHTYTEFQSCMYKSLASSVSDLMDPQHYDRRFREDKEKQKKDRAAYRKSSSSSSSSSSGTKKEREAREKEREAALFPPVLRVSPPQLLIVDRFTFAGMDVAKEFNISYVINNPHVLLDLDSPSWALPAPWSYLPPVPPLSLSSRVSNLFHRLNYRAAMLRAFGQVNQNRIKSGLSSLTSWSDYFASPLILTNTVWGIELHRSADSQGMHSHRNVNVQANGYTPRFKMTGPLLPMTNLTTSLDPMIQPRYAIEWEPKLTRFITRTKKENKKLIYINLGDGDDLTRFDVQAILAGLKGFSKQYNVLWSLPKRNVKSLLGDWDSFPSFLFHTAFVPQFPFLTTHRDLLAFVITHGSLSNLQESLAASLPILCLPHPYVDQFEIANRFARTGAVYVVQRVQVTEENIRRSVEKITADDSYTQPALQLAPLFRTSTSLGTNDVCGVIELVYRLGWNHLIPYTANPAAPLPWYRDFLYSFPLDIYAIYVIIITIIVYSVKQILQIFSNSWNGVK